MKKKKLKARIREMLNDAVRRQGRLSKLEPLCKAQHERVVELQAELEVMRAMMDSGRCERCDEAESDAALWRNECLRLRDEVQNRAKS